MTGSALLVVGDVVTDVLALHQAPIRAGTDTAADIVVRPGGSAANTAAWAAAFGADVRLLARVGTDTGEWHRRQLLAAGVRPHLSFDADRPTAVIVVMVDAAGERTMLTHRGAGGHLGRADWDDALLDGAAHLHISGYALFGAGGCGLVRLAITRARRRGVRVSVDPASTGFLAHFGVERFIAATAGCVILPNHAEAELLTGTSDAEAAAITLSRSYELAVVKLGGAGALAARAGEITVRVAGGRARAVDSTGAGDAFAGGFLAARLGGAGDHAAVVAGCHAGAAAVSQVGARPRAGWAPAAPVRQAADGRVADSLS
ncbi:MAG TPA: PfkB family carbohydrate kinase [Streptosporangiaceae bacterium]|nr:PfkB family carbohydrate kinase [Streptosporangiaceae bacterium]